MENDVTFDGEKIREGVKLILEGVGEDPHREGLIKTPDRVSRMYEEIFQGLREDSSQVLNTVFVLKQTVYLKPLGLYWFLKLL